MKRAPDERKAVGSLIVATLISPPAVATALAVLMWLLAQLLPGQMGLAHKILAAIFILLGGTIIAAAFIAFRQASTTIDPIRPDQATALVTNGVFRFSRNPFYLGHLCILLAWALILASPAAFALPPLYALYLNRFQIPREEAALHTLFGAAYDAYRTKVRRWL